MSCGDTLAVQGYKAVRCKVMQRPRPGTRNSCEPRCVQDHSCSVVKRTCHESLSGRDRVVRKQQSRSRNVANTNHGDPTLALCTSKHTRLQQSPLPRPATRSNRGAVKAGVDLGRRSMRQRVIATTAARRGPTGFDQKTARTAQSTRHFFRAAKPCRLEELNPRRATNPCQ